MEIEFTSRYGDRVPSWLRSCHGGCEAMGFVPVDNPDRWQVVRNKHQAYYAAAWREAEAAHASEDGWHFVKCPECRGTGRVSWGRTLLENSRLVPKRPLHMAND